MLGFRGHFSTKGRTYSITLAALRAERAAYQRERAIAAGLAPPPAGDTTLVLAHWYLAGRGEYVNRSALTVADYPAEWADTHASTVKPKTLAGYRHDVDHYIVPVSGGCGCKPCALP
jgi:hypothetical protein